MKTRHLGAILAALAAIVFVGSTASFAATFNITANAKGTSATVALDLVQPGYANLLSYTGTDSTGHAFWGQAAVQYNNGVSICTFTAIGGVSESGTVLTLVAATAITIEPGVGKLFTQASAGTGCFNSTTGDFSISQTDTIVGGGGTYANATGTETDTFLGHDVGNPTSGSFSFEKFSSSASITTP